MALVPLLAESAPDLRVGLHEHAGLRAVHTGPEAPLRVRQVALIVELDGVLAEVPHVPVVVLRVVVERPLGELPVEEEPIEDDPALDSVDDLRSGRHDEHVPSLFAILGAFVDEPRPGLQRKPGIVDVRGEVPGFDHRVILGAGPECREVIGVF